VRAQLREPGELDAAGELVRPVQEISDAKLFTPPT
jgi:hypothetical protein